MKSYRFLKIDWSSWVRMSSELNTALLPTDRVVAMSATGDEVLLLLEEDEPE